VIKKFPELSIVYSEKRHSINLSTAYIRGICCNNLWKVSSFKLTLKISFLSKQEVLNWPLGHYMNLTSCLSPKELEKLLSSELISSDTISSHQTKMCYRNIEWKPLSKLKSIRETRSSSDIYCWLYRKCQLFNDIVLLFTL
jgi:hypothetical protein